MGRVHAVTLLRGERPKYLQKKMKVYFWHSQFFLQILEESQFSCLAACQGRIKSSPSKSIPCTNVPITNILGRASQKNTVK